MIKLGQGNNHKQIILQIDNLMIILNLMTSEKKKKKIIKGIFSAL